MTTKNLEDALKAAGWEVVMDDPHTMDTRVIRPVVKQPEKLEYRLVFREFDSDNASNLLYKPLILSLPQAKAISAFIEVSLECLTDDSVEDRFYEGHPIARAFNKARNALRREQ